MINDEPEPEKPRYRVAGGILLGSRGRWPMAVADETEELLASPGANTLSVAKPYQVIGYPRRVSSGVWRVGPILSRKIPNTLVPVWRGVIPDGGCQFFIRDEYTPELVSSGGTYYATGRSILTTSELVQKEWSFSDSESRLYTFNSATGVVGQTAIQLTRISVVAESEGVYYLCKLVSPDDPPHNPFSFPSDFDLDNPL